MPLLSGLLQRLPDACREVAGIIGFRTLPLAAFVAASGRVRPAGRLAAVLTIGAITLAFQRWQLVSITSVASAYAYFLAAGSLVPTLSSQLRRRRLTMGATFTACSILFFAVPALLWSPTAKAEVALLLGWELMLSSYSYCVEVARSQDKPSYADCLFFLLVNPCVVYARRGQRFGPPRPDGPGIGRLVLAVAVFFVVPLVLIPVYDASRVPVGARFGLAMVASGLMRFLVQYARQSALASFQLGSLRQLGYAVPERYHWPVFASGPADFFRRWNTYIGEWLLRYVFWPLSFRLGVAVPRRRLRLATTAAALVMTFIACGALHDLAMYGTNFVLDTVYIQLFALSALLVGMAYVASMAWRSLQTRFGSSGALGTLAPVASRVVLWTAVTALFATWFR